MHYYSILHQLFYLLVTYITYTASRETKAILDHISQC